MAQVSSNVCTVCLDSGVIKAGTTSTLPIRQRNLGKHLLSAGTNESIEDWSVSEKFIVQERKINAGHGDLFMIFNSASLFDQLENANTIKRNQGSKGSTQDNIPSVRKNGTFVINLDNYTKVGTDSVSCFC